MQKAFVWFNDVKREIFSTSPSITQLSEVLFKYITRIEQTQVCVLYLFEKPKYKIERKQRQNHKTL